MAASRRKRSERGVVVVVTALMLVFIVIPVIGLAIDGGVLLSLIHISEPTRPY